MTRSVEQLISGRQYFRKADQALPVSSSSLSPCTNLPLPLNVYAHALQLQEGRVFDIHYGLFQNRPDSLYAAQQFYADWLLEKLPPPPCRILKAGIGLVGAFLTQLNQHGYDVQGVTGDTGLTAIHQACKLEASAGNHSQQTLSTAPASFAAVLFQEFTQHAEPLAIFNIAFDLLPPGGDLFFIDNFLLKNDAAVHPSQGMQHLDSMMVLAGRFGFELIENTNLTASAAPTLDYLQRAIASHRSRLIKDLALNPEQLPQLEHALQLSREKYADGQCGYILLHFRKKTPPKWRLQLLEKKHATAVFDLFKKTFGHDMPPAVWHWKYHSYPGREIGVWREDKLVGHYGGIARKILFFGQPRMAVQIGDVMVDSNERGVLTRKGPFFLMAATFLERYIGYNKPYLIGFGFPNERALKVAKRLGLYEEAGKMTEFSWRPVSKWPRLKTRLQSIDRADDDQAAGAIEACWQQMAEDLHAALVGVRDWCYLQHRYLNHPVNRYQIVLVKNRFGGKARGAMVLRQDSADCEIVDIIAPLAEIPVLILHARRLAGIYGQQRLFCRITENFAAHFAAAGGIRQTLDMRIPASVWDAAPPIDSLRDRWWLMSGDTDFR